MNAITEMLMSQLAGGALSQISGKLGVDQSTTSKALEIAVPLLISALARNSSTPSGAQALDQAVAKDHDGSILDDLGGFLNNTQAANGGGILGHVFGAQRGVVENGLAQSSGLDPSAAGQLLETVAPLVMGALGKTRQQEGLDAAGLSALLDNESQQAQAAAPDLMGALGSFLDSNKDGNVMDDVGRIAGNLFRR